MINFTLDAIDRALKDLHTSLSDNTNQSEENIATQEIEESKSEKKYPETMFTDVDLCQIIRNFNLKFNSESELIEVCLVSITVTSWLLPTHQAASI